MQTERGKYVFKRDLDHNSDGTHLTSFGIEFQSEEEAKENERSQSVALLCEGLLRRDMVYEQKRVLPVCVGFFFSMYCCGSGSTNKLFGKCFLS